MSDKLEKRDAILGGSKRYSVADGVSIKSKRSNDEWGVFNEDWGFRIWDIPEEFRTEKSGNVWTMIPNSQRLGP